MNRKANALQMEHWCRLNLARYQQLLQVEIRILFIQEINKTANSGTALSVVIIITVFIRELGISSKSLLGFIESSYLTLWVFTPHGYISPSAE